MPAPGCGPPSASSPGSTTGVSRWPSADRPTSTTGSPPDPPATRCGTSSTGLPTTAPVPPWWCQASAERPDQPPAPRTAGRWSPGCCTTTPSSSPTGSPAPSCSATASSCPPIAVMTTAQVHRGPDAVSVRFGAHDITVPEPLAGLVTELIDTGRRYVGVGAPTASPWLFPDTCPAARLRPPDWANGCAPSAYAPCPGGVIGRPGR